MKNIILKLLLLFILPASIYAQVKVGNNTSESIKQKWVDSVFNSLSVEERIAQLIVIRSFSDRDSIYYDTIVKHITKYNIGGICFFKGSPTSQAGATNYYQKFAKTPLLISIDGEWGLAMRLDSTVSFPRQMTLGALEKDDLIYRLGCEIARQCKLLGIHINFAPVADINSNPKNPIINSRSFGEDKVKVARKCVAYMKGMQNCGLITTAKHFPGHGDTDSDSHLKLPIINHSKEMIDTLDLYPFKELIKNGLNGLMVAHLYIPSLDSVKNTPSTLSKTIVTEKLKKELGFKGLIFTDALEMKGIANYYKAGEIEIKALQAGNDVLLLPESVGTAISSIKTAIDSNLVSLDELNIKCKKVLSYKFDMGLNKSAMVSTDKLFDKLNNRESDVLCTEIYRDAVTLVKNDNNIIPLKNIEKYNTIAVLAIGDEMENNFQKTLRKYAKVTCYNLSKDFNLHLNENFIKEISKHDLIIISIHNTNSHFETNFGMTKQTFELVEQLSKKTQVVLDIFGYPYTLSLFNDKNIPAIIVSYQDKPETQNVSAQLIFGGSEAKGILPVTINEKYPLDLSLKTSRNRLGYVLPEEINLDNELLNKIDNIAMNGIKEKAFPGCQILAAKDGKVFYQKSFGTKSYDDNSPVTNDNIYDLASVTKVAATTLAMMKLYQLGKIDLDKKLSDYLKYLKHSNKKDITIRKVMTHQARLKPWIAFYTKTLVNGTLDSNFYRKTPSKKYGIKVADSIYLRSNFQVSILKDIINSDLLEKEEYVYSDLGFYLLRELVEKVAKQPLDQFVNEQFYTPLGLTNTFYNPLEHQPLSNIIPTENDIDFRKQLVRGYVHDQGAAMLGGISGHAGLFSNANELAVIFQMLLQKGTYGGKRYLDSATVELFTRQQFPLFKNRRGLGFDRQLPTPSESGPVCKSASQLSYGHSGFTGTYVWTDPKENLVYVFLSNRVCPDANNHKITDLNIRTNVHQLIYDAIKASKKQNSNK